MSTTPPKKPDSPFFEIKDSILIAKIFDVLTRHRVLVTLWLKNQSLKFEAELTYEARTYKNAVARLPALIPSESFNELLAAQKSNDLLGSFIIDSASFFFRTQTRPIGKDIGFVHFPVPTSIFKLQRRTNLRIPFGRANAIKVTVFNPLLEWDVKKPISDKDLIVMRMLDLSAGGCAVAARIEDKDKFQDGVVLHDVRFNLQAASIVTEAVVRHVRETTNDKGKPMLRVGLQFQAMRKHFESHITAFVIDESRKIFTLLP